MKRLANFAPLLVAVFTVTSLYAANAARLEWSQMLMPLILALTLAGLFMLIFWLCPFTSRYWQFAATTFTMCALLWYMAGAVLCSILMAATIAAIFLKKRTIYLKHGAFLIAASTLFATVITLCMSGYSTLQNVTNVQAQPYTLNTAADNSPNIYFIVPDRMPSPVAMRQAGIYPDSFVAAMRELGFYVPENNMSRDTYTPTYEGKVYTTRTMRFFASALNLGVDIPMDISYKDCLSMIKYPSVFEALHEKGYIVANVASWFAETKNMPTADFNETYPDASLLEKFYENELAAQYWERTILKGLNFRYYEQGITKGRIDRARHLWQRNHIVGWATNPDSGNFIMSHILLPHEPFVWSGDGEPLDTGLPQPEQYYEQIRFAMMYLENMAKLILKYDPNAIIIIQSDEGMAYHKPAELNYSLTPEQWNGVFTAWRIPGADTNELENLRHTEIVDWLLSQ